MIMTAKKTQASSVSPILLKEEPSKIGTTRKTVVKSAAPTANRISFGQVRLIPPYNLSVNLLNELLSSMIKQSFLPLVLTIFPHSKRHFTFPAVILKHTVFPANTAGREHGISCQVLRIECSNRICSICR